MLNLKNSFAFGIFLSLLTSGSLLAQAGPKIATINIEDIRSEHHLVKRNIKEMQEKRAKLEDAPISKRLQEKREKLEAAAKALSDAMKSQDRDPATIEDLRIEAQSANGDLRSLFKDWQQWSQAEIRNLNVEFAIKERKAYDIIQAAAATIAQKMGFDLVFEPNGATSSQLPVILYLRGGTDITEEVIKEVNKDAPPEEPTTEVAEPRN